MINKVYRERLLSLKHALKYMVLEERLPLEAYIADIDLKKIEMYFKNSK